MFKRLDLKLNYPIKKEGLVEYIGFPSNYILKNRLALNSEEVYAIKLAWQDYQDKVQGVLKTRYQNLLNNKKIKQKYRLNQGNY